MAPAANRHLDARVLTKHQASDPARLLAVGFSFRSNFLKSLKFKSHLVDQILDGTKSVTWRLFDDKDLQVGDELEFVNADTKRSFAKAVILEIREKELGQISDDDFNFSEYKKETPEELLEHYRRIYGDKVKLDTIVKMIKFKLCE